jgi:transmembrane sensor
MFWPFVSRRERLRVEASDWIARLNGPCEEKDRAEFGRWYHSSADHSEAYDRLTAQFEVAGRARRPAAAGAGSPTAPADGRSRPFRYAVAAAVACAVLLAFVLLAARPAPPVSDNQQQFATLSSGEGESRRMVLVDGSEVRLSPGSIVEVALGANERRLRLVRGEGRFTVAHEPRPFVVAADTAEVVARGTQFVIRVASGRTIVSLIEGRVDVSYPSSPGRGGRRRLTRLQAGQQLVVPSGDMPAVRSPAAAPSNEPPRRAPQAVMIQFDDTPLGQVVEQVNRPGQPLVRLSDPAIANLRVTGAFRSGDTAGFAESMAAAFDLDVERGAGGSLWLRLRPGARARH